MLNQDLKTINQQFIIEHRNKRFYEKNAVFHYNAVKDSLFNEFGTTGLEIFINIDMFHVNIECLYQAMRFPEHPNIQDEIICVGNPEMAKQIADKYIELSRPDFDDYNIEIMRWCLKLLMAENLSFRDYLLQTGNREIVDITKDDSFWGVVELDPFLLFGTNYMGKLLVELREEYRQSLSTGIEEHLRVLPPKIDGFKLYGFEVSVIDMRSDSFTDNLVPDCCDWEE